MTEKIELLGLSREEIEAEVAKLGEKPFRAKQLWQWLYYRGETDFEKIYEAQLLRYEEIRNGAAFDPSENVLPSRDDLALVFSTMRKEYRAGHTMFSIRRILAILSETDINYIKLKFIIRIMQELQVCEVTETSKDRYLFGFGYKAEKTNIEKSSILRKLRSQLRKA